MTELHASLKDSQLVLTGVRTQRFFPLLRRSNATAVAAIPTRCACSAAAVDANATAAAAWHGLPIETLPAATIAMPLGCWLIHAVFCECQSFTGGARQVVDDSS